MKKNKMVTVKIVVLLLFLVGLAVTTASLVLIGTHAIKSLNYTPMNAIVVEHNEKENGLKAIVIEYNIENKYYRLKSKHFSKKPENIDSIVKIKYNPKKPTEVIWIDNNHNGKYLAAGLILLAGDVFIWFVLKLFDKESEESEKENTIPVKKEKPVKEKKQKQKKEKKKRGKEENQPLFEEEETPDIFKPLTPKELKKLEKEEKKKLKQKNKKEEPIIESVAIKEEQKEELIKDEPVREKVSTTKVEEPKKDKNRLVLNLPEMENLKQNISEIIIEDSVEITDIKKTENSNPEKVTFNFKQEIPKRIIIPEIPIDSDSPREAVLSNIMETTIAIPKLTNEKIELYTKNKNSSIKINKDFKDEALAQLLKNFEDKE